MYGEATNPLPYLAVSYILGFILIFGFGFWIYKSRAKTIQYLSVLKNHSKGSTHGQ